MKFRTEVSIYKQKSIIYQQMKAKYSIYQLNTSDEGKKLLHLTFADIHEKVNPALYDKVWDGEIEYEKNPIKAIEAEIGTDLPAGFYGHMLSISDIIVINSEEAFYVDGTGYKKLGDDVLSKLVA